ncbi:MAG: hypothetical protein U1F57_10210 [bacterium]
MKKLSLFFPLLLLFSVPAWACDFCSIYMSNQAATANAKGFYFGVAEQFTHYGTLQLNGSQVPNPLGQYMDSSITQFVAGYGVNDYFGFQINLPYIRRSFLRPHAGVVERGSENGLGDMTLLGKFLAYRRLSERSSYTWHLIGGVKFPTGSSDRLKEELPGAGGGEGEATGHEEMLVKRHEGHDNGDDSGLPESGIHGHDLALGSGSWDAIIGTEFFGRIKRFFWTTGALLTVRTTGDFDYRYGNEVQWSGGPGAYLLMNHAWTVAVQARFSGEYKGLDSQAGVPATDTGMNSVYIGPEVLLTWKKYLSGGVGADFPVVLDNTDLQAVPDYRFRASLTGHF